MQGPGPSAQCLLDLLALGLAPGVRVVGCHVEAACLDPGHFSLRLEIEPYEGPGTLAGRAAAEPAEERVPLWEASAAVGNSRGVFDACYRYGNSQGDEGHLLGTSQELGAELARVLQELTRGDVETMKYRTTRFFMELVITLPEQA